MSARSGLRMCRAVISSAHLAARRSAGPGAHVTTYLGPWVGASAVAAVEADCSATWVSRQLPWLTAEAGGDDDDEDTECAVMLPVSGTI